MKRRIVCGWTKKKEATGVLCDKIIPIRLKDKFYWSVIRSAMLYGLECWLDDKKIDHERTAKMAILKWMSGVTIEDRIRNK